MLLQTKAELSPAEILRAATKEIEERNGLERERKIHAILAAAKVWREDSIRHGEHSIAAVDAYRMLEIECRRVIR